MATVNVEFSAFADPRFKVLAKLTGQTHYDALGRMAAVWAHCVEKSDGVLTDDLIDILANMEGYAQAMIDADLGERLDAGEVRIKGTEGRIEWLARARQRQKKATEAAKEKRAGGSHSRATPTSDPTLVSSSAPVSASISAPAPASASVSAALSALATARKKEGLATAEAAARLWGFYLDRWKQQGTSQSNNRKMPTTVCESLVKIGGLELAKKLVTAYLKDQSDEVIAKDWTLSFLLAHRHDYLAMPEVGYTPPRYDERDDS